MATSNAPWLTVVTGGSGSGNGSVTYRASANTGNRQRSGSLTIAGRTVNVSQPPSPPTPPGSPRLTSQ
jgi:hypothetical protein